jgi:hypothetical protein
MTNGKVRKHPDVFLLESTSIPWNLGQTIQCPIPFPDPSHLITAIHSSNDLIDPKWEDDLQKEEGLPLTTASCFMHLSSLGRLF